MRYSIIFIFCCSLALLSACRHNPQTPIDPTPSDQYGNFPEDVGKIFITKCATSGCHNDKSYENAGDLRLDKWEYLFQGGDNGSPVIPYSTINSSLLYFINDTNYPGVAYDRMPKDAPPLSKEEYQTIYNWVAKGAPDKNGNIPFATNAATRQKIYLTQQGCDFVAVIDAETRMVMRYIKVGMDDSRSESPHNVKFSPDGRYAYVCFSSGEYLQKIDATADTIVGSIKLTTGNSNTSFNVLAISPDGSQVIVSDWVTQGSLVLVNTNTMSISKIYNADYSSPHGIIANASFDTFFVTAQSGNAIYKLSKDGRSKKLISLDGDEATASGPNRHPHDMIMTPDFSRYFVTCEQSNEVRVMDAHADTLIKVIPVGVFPQELAISPQTSQVFVTCMEDPANAGSLFRGSVYAINYNTYSSKKIEASYSRPHGITVDEKYGVIYVASVNTTGPLPHHVSACGGNNGYYQVFDLYTLKPLNNKDRRFEVSVAPYSFATRFTKIN